MPARDPLIRPARQPRRRRSSSRVLPVLAVLAAVAVLAAAGAAWTSRSGTDRTALSAQPAPVALAERSVPATVAVPEMARPATITVSAVGDMIFDRRVGALVAARGGEAPLASVAPLLARADVTVGNLESPLSNGGERNTAKDVTFRGDPRAIAGLTASGFDFLSLANNHVLDYGPAALADTVALLDQAGIAHAGAGADSSAAWAPAVHEVNGASVAFLSFSHIVPAGFTATSERAGLAAGRTDMDAVAEAVRAAKEEQDYVIVSFHWGVEYEDYANGDQVRDAHTTIDAGADMVLSHHPHVIQGVEYYNGRLIAYSLGDFVFDHYSRKTGEAFVLDASLGPDGVTDAVCTPVYLDADGAPEVVTGSEATVILERLKAISSPHGTAVAVDGDTARVLP